MTLPLSEIERALEAGTQGVWSVFAQFDCIAIEPRKKPTGKRPCIVDWTGFDSNDIPTAKNLANAQLIALLHNHAPAMIARIRELEGLLREIAADLRFNSDTHSAEWAGRINTALKD